MRIMVYILTINTRLSPDPVCPIKKRRIFPKAYKIIKPTVGRERGWYLKVNISDIGHILRCETKDCNVIICRNSSVMAIIGSY